MNIRTNLLEEYVNFVDTTKKRNKKLWICIFILRCILFILVIITFRYIQLYLKIYLGILTNI